MKNKKEFMYFFLCTIIYVVLNFALTKIFNISFNVHSNGNITLGTYHILRLVEIVLISVFCFFKKFKFLIYFDICLIISWITDFFINFYFFDKSVSISFLLLSVIVMFGYILNCVSDIMSRKLNKIDFYKKYKPYILMLLFLLTYITLFAINLSIPVEYKILSKTTSYTARMWMIGNLSLLILAIYYIFKIKFLNVKDLLISTALGIFTFILSKDPIGSIENILCCYAACGLFKKCSSEKNLPGFNFNEIVKSLGFGILIGIPLGIINILNTQGHSIFDLQVWNLSNIWNSLINSSGAISEEITYHFFPFAIIIYWFNGKISKNYKTQIPIYIFLIMPHAMNHIASSFIINPSMAIIDCIREAIIFGIPFIWLMTNKGILANSMCHTIVVLFYRMCGNVYTS